MTESNQVENEISCKVLCLGPEGAGKTTNLLSLKEQISSSDKDLSQEAKSLSLQETGLAFKFLPLNLDSFPGGIFKLHIFSFDLPLPYPSLRKLLWQGVDAVMMVFDSQIPRMGENLDFLQESRRLFLKEGYNLQSLPQVIQYNKRDCQDKTDLAIMRRYLNPENFPEHEAIAKEGRGTLESLSSLTRQLVHLYQQEDSRIVAQEKKIRKTISESSFSQPTL